jgi:hypothetical protein
MIYENEQDATVHVSGDIFARNMYSSQGIIILHSCNLLVIFVYHDARKHEYQVQ